MGLIMLKTEVSIKLKRAIMEVFYVFISGGYAKTAQNQTITFAGTPRMGHIRHYSGFLSKILNLESAKMNQKQNKVSENTGKHILRFI